MERRKEGRKVVKKKLNQIRMEEEKVRGRGKKRKSKVETKENKK